MDKTVLFYFFSTVPQVLGAVLALLGIFFFSKLDSIKRDALVYIEFLYRDSIVSSITYPKSNKGSRFAYSQAPDLCRVIERKFSRKDFVSGYKAVGFLYKYLGNNREKNDTNHTKVRNLMRYYCEKALGYKQESEVFINSSKRVFIKVGIIVFLFISLLVFTPMFYADCYLYWGSIVFGLLMTAYSLYALIHYMINALTSMENQIIIEDEESEQENHPPENGRTSQ